MRSWATVEFSWNYVLVSNSKEISDIGVWWEGYRLTRAGAATLLLHDISDIFMELAKLFKYSRNELGASISFSLFVVSWFVLRLIIFPLWVIWSIRFECSLTIILSPKCISPALCNSHQFFQEPKSFKSCEIYAAYIIDCCSARNTWHACLSHAAELNLLKMFFPRSPLFASGNEPISLSSGQEWN